MMSVLQAMKRFDKIRAVWNVNFLSFRNSHNGHIVQMRGLDNDTTEDDVIDFFKPLGVVPAKIHLKRDGSGRTAGFSEVEFSTHAEAVVALRKKNAFIGNRFIRLTLKSTDVAGIKSSEVDSAKANSIENERTQPSSKVSAQTEGKILDSLHSSGYFIRMTNLPRRITEQDIFDFFWPVGANVASITPLYNESGNRTGEFDVQFLSLESVQRAAAKNNAYLRNKFVQLSFKHSGMK